ncbi:MAG: RnfH family protein [Betaproteobacteria bacterium]|nr:RnfH family protein [Betaproteobacteria bacterium]
MMESSLTQGEETIAVAVVCVFQNRVIMRDFRLPLHSTVADALAVARASGAFPSDDENTWGYAIFGQCAPPETLLHDGDRLEWLRPLHCDPKTSRRRRAKSKVSG